MILSRKWLSDFVDLADVTDRDFLHKMTMSGSKAESSKSDLSGFSGVTAGKILEINQHPDADKLRICSVDIGKTEPIQIVTNAVNLTVGCIVPVALDGAVLANGIKIKKGKLRGVESFGMFCGLSEIGVTKNDFPYADEDSVMIIQDDCNPGDDIHTALGLDDTSVEFEITSNRPDCLSVIGLAYEASATFDRPAVIPKPAIKGSGGDVNDYLSVEVHNKNLCLRYSAKVIKNAIIKPSPLWMRNRLRASGIRPINNIVDITNYVMLEYGQPMHAFDLSYVEDRKIIVRNAIENETIITLDGIERSLSCEMLVIADGKKPSAVAGIMGGENSGVSDSTTTICFEAACFNGTSVRKTSQKLALRTESSSRFEKGLDPEITLQALLRACELVEKLGIGEVVDGIIDVRGELPETVTLKLEPEKINSLIGFDLTKNQMTEILQKLQFTVEGDTITVPAFRIDVHENCDIAEEIARIYGYDNIPSDSAPGTSDGKITPYQKFIRIITETLIGCGCFEIMTNSFMSPKSFAKIRSQKPENCVTVENPLGEDTCLMQSDTIPAFMDVISKNIGNRNLNGSLFEISKEYFKKTELADEINMLTIALFGNNCDFYKLKGICEEIFESLNLPKASYKSTAENPTFHPGRCAVISDGSARQIPLGIIGQLHPTVCENYGIKQNVFVLKLKLKELFDIASEVVIKYRPLPKFPAITRDLAIICPIETESAEIEQIIADKGGKLVESITLFDVYMGEQLEKGKKSIAYSITLRDSSATLTDADADDAVSKIIKSLEKSGFALRT